MDLGKVMKGSFGAIIVLIISQSLAIAIGSALVKIKVSIGVGNIIAGILYLALTYILLTILAKKILKMDMKTLGIPKFYIKIKWLVIAVALPLLVTGAYLLLPGTFVRSDMDDQQIFSVLSAGIVFTGIASGFVEEMVFRGVIFNLLELKWNRGIAIVVPSILFGVLHIIGMKFSVLSCMLVLVAGTMVGIMFSLIALEERSIWHSGIVHALWNIVIIGGGLTISEVADEYAILTYVLDTNKFWITGGEFGIESSVIAVIGYILVALLAAWMIRKREKHIKNGKGTSNVWH